MCFALLIFVQCSVSICSEETDISVERCQNVVTVLHHFVNYAKEITDPVVSVFYLILTEKNTSLKWILKYTSLENRRPGCYDVLLKRLKYISKKC